MPLFPHEANLTIDVTNLLGGILYPFAASFLFPVSLNTNPLISITLNTSSKLNLELKFYYFYFLLINTLTMSF